MSFFFTLLLLLSLLQQQCWSCKNETCRNADDLAWRVRGLFLQVDSSERVAADSRLIITDGTSVQVHKSDFPARLKVNHPANEASQDENRCQLVSSRGLLFSCDVHPIIQGSDAPSLSLVDHADVTGARSVIHLASANLAQLGMLHYEEDIEKFGDGAVVYVVTTALGPFVHQILPQLKTSIKLVTGDSDRGPVNVLGKASFDELVNHPRVMKWWGQNAVDGEASNPKFVQMPIGMDYHTLKAGAGKYGLQASPQAQETALLAAFKAAPSFMNRSAKVFYAGSASSALRARISDLLSAQPDLVDAHDSEFERNAFWTQVGSHRFVASPPGNGVDCHRTWESIALGAIPLVSDRLHGLYERNGFNVVMLSDDDWGNLSSAAVKQKMDEASAKYKASIPESMLLKYWMDQIRST